MKNDVDKCPRCGSNAIDSARFSRALPPEPVCRRCGCLIAAEPKR